MKQNFQILYSNNHTLAYLQYNDNNIIMIMYIIQIWYVLYIIIVNACTVIDTRKKDLLSWVVAIGKYVIY